MYHDFKIREDRFAPERLVLTAGSAMTVDVLRNRLDDRETFTEELA